MTKITPFQTGFPLDTATHISIKPLISDTTATSCNTYWELLKVTETTVQRPSKDQNNQPIMVDAVSKSVEVLQKGNTPITEAEYALWGGDNADLENILLGKLGLTRFI